MGQSGGYPRIFLGRDEGTINTKVETETTARLLAERSLINTSRHGRDGRGCVLDPVREFQGSCSTSWKFWRPFRKHTDDVPCWWSALAPQVTLRRRLGAAHRCRTVPGLAFA